MADDEISQLQPEWPNKASLDRQSSTGSLEYESSAGSLDAVTDEEERLSKKQVR